MYHIHAEMLKIRYTASEEGVCKKTILPAQFSNKFKTSLKNSLIKKRRVLLHQVFFFLFLLTLSFSSGMLELTVT